MPVFFAVYVCMYHLIWKKCLYDVYVRLQISCYSTWYHLKRETSSYHAQTEPWGTVKNKSPFYHTVDEEESIIAPFTRCSSYTLGAVCPQAKVRGGDLMTTKRFLNNITGDYGTNGYTINTMRAKAQNSLDCSHTFRTSPSTPPSFPWYSTLCSRAGRCWHQTLRLTPFWSGAAVGGVLSECRAVFLSIKW